MADTEIVFKISAHDDFIVCHAVFCANHKQTANVLISLTPSLPRPKSCRFQMHGKHDCIILCVSWTEKVNEDMCIMCLLDATYQGEKSEHAASSGLVASPNPIAAIPFARASGKGLL